MNVDKVIDLILALALIVAAIAAIVVIWSVSPWGCDARWDLATDWRPFVGCMVETSEGFIREQHIRVQP